MRGNFLNWLNLPQPYIPQTAQIFPNATPGFCSSNILEQPMNQSLSFWDQEILQLTALATSGLPTTSSLDRNSLSPHFQSPHCLDCNPAGTWSKANLYEVVASMAQDSGSVLTQKVKYGLAISASEPLKSPCAAMGTVCRSFQRKAKHFHWIDHGVHPESHPVVTPRASYSACRVSPAIKRATFGSPASEIPQQRPAKLGFMKMAKRQNLTASNTLS